MKKILKHTNGDVAVINHDGTSYSLHSDMTVSFRYWTDNDFSSDWKPVDSIYNTNLEYLLREEAKMRFPVGRSFSNKNIIPHSFRKPTISEQHFKIDIIHNSLIIYSMKNGMNNCSYTIFKDGVWANVIIPSYEEDFSVHIPERINERPLTPEECYKASEVVATNNSGKLIMTGTGGNIDGIDFKKYWDSIPSIFPVDKIEKHIETITLRKNIVLLL